MFELTNTLATNLKQQQQKQAVSMLGKLPTYCFPS